MSDTTKSKDKSKDKKDKKDKSKDKKKRVRSEDLDEETNGVHESSKIKEYVYGYFVGAHDGFGVLKYVDSTGPAARSAKPKRPRLFPRLAMMPRVRLSKDWMVCTAYNSPFFRIQRKYFFQSLKMWKSSLPTCFCCLSTQLLCRRLNYLPSTLL
jgi:hypothetical protein